jgi:hypothetical protein
LDGEPPTSDEAIHAQRTKGTFLLAVADALLRDDRAGADALEDIVRRLWESGGRLGFFDLLHQVYPGTDWRPLRSLAASERGIGREWLPKVGIQPLALTPKPAGEARGSEELRLLVTANLRGMLEVCGCVARQFGGIARRETLRRRFLATGPAPLLVDLGNAYTCDRREPILGPVEREELDLVLELMGRQSYVAAAVGHFEMLRGPAFFEEQARRRPLPYVNSNLEHAGEPLAAAFRITHTGGARIAWLSALEPAWYSQEHARFYEQRLHDLHAGDALTALAETARSTRHQADVVIVIGSLSPILVRRILDDIPEIDAILSSEGADAALGGLFSFPGDGEQALMGFYGRRLIFFSSGEGRWLEELRLTTDVTKRLTGARIDFHPLAEQIPDFPPFRRRLERFYDSMKSRPEIAGSERPVARHLPELLEAEYSGASSCQGCHQPQWAQWMATSHASAFGTLAARHRNYAPRCVGCHVTGYGYPSGYRLGDPLETLRHVQCEMCHGPGAHHVLSPSSLNIRGRPPAQTCYECHTPEHSDMHEVNFEDYYARVVHGTPAGESWVW